MTPLRTISAQAPATPDADEARRAAGRELSRPIYHDHHDLWDRLWSWLKGLFDVDSMVPGVPPWVSTLIVVLVVAAGIALLILLSVFTDDRDADTLTRAADTAAAQADFTTAVVERFRAIIRSLDERGIIDEYPGMTALEAATLTHQALGEHRVVAPLYEAAHLFDAVLYGRVVSTSAQDQQMRELADQMTTVRLPSGRALVGASAQAPGTPA